MKPAHWKDLKSECSESIDSLLDLLAGRFSDGVMRRLATSSPRANGKAAAKRPRNMAAAVTAAKISLVKKAAKTARANKPSVASGSSKKPRSAKKAAAPARASFLPASKPAKRAR